MIACVHGISPQKSPVAYLSLLFSFLPHGQALTLADFSCIIITFFPELLLIENIMRGKGDPAGHTDYVRLFSISSYQRTV